MTRKNHNHLNLLCDVGELAALLAGSENIENFLQRIVEMVARHMSTDVCSIYLLDEQTNELVLKATVGFNSAVIGKIRLKIGEGLVGTTLEKLKPVREGLASRHPKSKYFNEACEDPFDSFLAVPLLRGAEKIGVLVVQHRQRDYFDKIDALALRAIASQLAGAVGNARLLIDHTGRDLNKKYTNQVFKTPGILKGQVASYGFAVGPTTVFDKSPGSLVSAALDPNSILTLTDFHRAVRDTTDQLQKLQSRFAQCLAESASLIFTAHLMILKDVHFIGEMEKRIKNGISVAAAVNTVTKHYIDLFESSAYGHIKEKANDVQDLARRLLRNLEHIVQDTPILIENRIVIASQLYPSDVLRLASEDIEGIVLVSGGVTSHVAIIAQSLRIPLIIVNRPELLQLRDGTPILMDSESASIYIQPSEEVIRKVRSQKQSPIDTEGLSQDMSSVTYTKDGVRIRLLANINLLSDLALARDVKAEGVGLYRTEFPFLIRSAVLSEDEQFHVYKRLFDEMPGREVTIRVLDIGGDKLLAYSDATAEANPALGLRALRFLFRHHDIFHQQLRAILRAAVEAENPRIMFPMISSLDDFLQARQTVYNCMADLERDKLSHHRNPLIGVLVELPCVIEIIDVLAAQADFLSIGTNDFIQYMLAVDRTNVKVCEYYQPYHPAVVRSLAKISKAARYRNKEISVCGELAHDTQYIPFLLGIGIRTLSVYPKFLPSVQKIISNCKLSDAKSFAEQLLSENSLKGTEEVLQRLTKEFDFNEPQW
ncbi:MAG: phosphoenolpyruvate--protein phosphotransferase [Desulfobacterales bacterium]|jgi:phosphotransferase system enzyme I (PtsP)